MVPMEPGGLKLLESYVIKLLNMPKNELQPKLVSININSCFILAVYLIVT